jgi:hypothetical protein
MGSRTARFALGAAIVLGAVILAFLFLAAGLDEAAVAPPEPLPEEMQADAPEEVINEPPSSVGEIETP